VHSRPFLAVFLAWAAAFGILFWGLGSVPLTDVDEGAFAEATREMLARRDFISPWLLDAPRFDKPVLIHWAQMLGFALLGESAWGARLPSAIAGLFWLAAIAAWAVSVLEKFGRVQQEEHRVAVYVWTLLIGATSLGIMVIARAATADALLNAWLAWALLFLYRAIWPADEKVRRRHVRFAALCVGLGLLTKGPVAVLVPSASLGLAAVFMGARERRYIARMLVDPWAWVILVGVSMPWYGLQFHAQGYAFIEGFFGQHNLGRFTDTMHGFSAGFWYYPLWIMVALLPWAPLVLRTVLGTITSLQLRSLPCRLALANFIFVMVFFSFSATKLPHYVFYGLSGLLVLMGITMGQTMSRGVSYRTLFDQRLFMVIALGGLATLPLWIGEVPLSIKSSYYMTVVADWRSVVQARALWFFIPIGLAALLVALLPIRAALALGSVCFIVGLQALVIGPGIGSFRGSIVEAAQVIRERQLAVASWRMYSPSLSFEAGQVIAAGEPTPGATMVLYFKDQPSLERRYQELHGHDAVLEVLWEKTGVRIVAIR